MIDGEELSVILEKVFTDPEFMVGLLSAPGEKTLKMSIVLNYYIVTRDANTHYTFEKLKEKYDEFLKDHPEKVEENAIKHGFLLHACNGNKYQRILRYGLDYESVPELQEEIENSRRIIKNIEENLGQTRYLKEENIDKKRRKIENKGNTVFLTTSARLAIDFALNASPERLFRGALDTWGFAVEGEKKKQYYYRTIEERLKEDGIDNPKTFEYLREAVDYFCSERPCIVLISFDDILDVQFWKRYVERGESTSIRELIDDGKLKFFSQYGVTSHSDDKFDYADIVTYCAQIPKKAVHIFHVMDDYEMNRMRAKQIGIRLGQIKSDKLAPIPLVESIIGNFTTTNELDELQGVIEEEKARTLSIKSSFKEKLKIVLLDFERTEEAKQYYDSISAEEKKLFEREFTVYEEFGRNIKERTIEGSMLDAEIDNFRNEGILDDILDKDLELKQDKEQFQDEIDGVPHARRVEFLLRLMGFWERLMLESDIRVLHAAAMNFNTKKMRWIRDKIVIKHESPIINVLDVIGQERLDLDDTELESLKFILESYLKNEGKERKPERMKKISISATRKEKLAALFLDVIEFDRMRFEPDKYDPKIAFDMNRLRLSGNYNRLFLGYESYCKILRVLDIEEEKRALEPFIEHSSRLDDLLRVEDQIKEQRKACNVKAQEKLGDLMEQSVNIITVGDTAKSINDVPSQQPLEQEDGLNEK